MLSHQSFFFVDKRFEISNLRLFTDIANVVRLEGILFPVSKVGELKSSRRHLMEPVYQKNLLTK
jgi:hypothetical protein